MLDELGIPVVYTHDGSSHVEGHHLSQLEDDKSRYKDSSVILLFRDPRDVTVSSFFQVTKRLKKEYTGTLSDFIRDKHHGLEKVIAFYRIWLRHLDIPQTTLIVSYEEMHDDAVATMKKILDFLQTPVPEKRLVALTEKFGFKNMQQMEKDGKFSGTYGKWLSPGDPEDPESFKTRKGKPGGYADYLSGEDIAWCNEVLKNANLDLGY